MQSVVCAGVASEVSWEDAKEGRCGFGGAGKGAALWCTCLSGANSMLLTRGELRGSWQAWSCAAASCAEQW